MPCQDSSTSAAPGQALVDLVAVMDRLRRECPWDRDQTHASLAPYLLEEAHEVLEALDAGDRTGLREELGDLLLQVLFHARIGQEHVAQPWGIDEVAGDARDKMVRRHPHVFADVTVSGSAEVLANWEHLKAAEKARASVLDGIPPSLPALARADKVLARVQRAGLTDAAASVASWAEPRAMGPADVAAVDGVTDVVGEDRDAADRAVGAALLGQVAAARAAGVDPEGALRRTLRELETAVRAAE